jgi:hypothetical protein
MSKLSSPPIPVRQGLWPILDLPLPSTIPVASQAADDELSQSSIAQEMSSEDDDDDQI